MAAFAITALRQREADKALAMWYYTTNTPPERASSGYQKRYSAMLAHKSPSIKDLRGHLLDEAYATVSQSVLCDLAESKYAIVTDGCSKRAAQRGTPRLRGEPF